MAVIVIGGANYDGYATVAEADTYLAADASRAVAWALLDADAKGRALMSGTRLLERQCWESGTAPDPTGVIIEPLRDATILLAADISVDPSKGDSGSTATNLKRAKAGSAEVEFFRDTSSLPLPDAPYALLVPTGLLCGTSGASSTDVPVITGSGYPSRFDDCDENDPALASYYG